MSDMTARERMLAAIARRPVDRLPTDIWATQEVWDKLFKHFGVDTRLAVYEKLAIDGIIGLAPAYIGPRPERARAYADQADGLASGGASGGPTFQVDENYFENEWGVGFRKKAYESGEYDEQVFYPLAEAETIADLEAYDWPSPDWYAYSRLPVRAAQFPDRAIMCGYTAIFYFHNLLRGLERSLMDPILKPDFTHYLVSRISAFFCEYHRRCFEAAKGAIDMTQVTDDFGSQTGLLISPAMFDTFYRKPIQRAIDLAKAYDLTVFHHDDGDMRLLLPRLTEMGIDVLNPIQWRCGNWDLEQLKQEYGHQLCFHGGVDNQHTLPFGTPADVAGEVRWLKRTLGKDGTGLVIAPCHNLQANTPVANIVALYETAAE